VADTRKIVFLFFMSRALSLGDRFYRYSAVATIVVLALGFVFFAFFAPGLRVNTIQRIPRGLYRSADEPIGKGRTSFFARRSCRCR
jgi:type IV secretory pathway protease TraF